MKITNVYGKHGLTREQKAKERAARKLFQDWQPGPEELLASDRWKGTIVVEGQQEFWKAMGELRDERQRQGLTLKDLSERCGIDVATLSRIENRKLSNPTLFTMLLYAGALGKRLHFSVCERRAAVIEIASIRDAETGRNGVPSSKPARPKVKRR